MTYGFVLITIGVAFSIAGRGARYASITRRWLYFAALTWIAYGGFQIYAEEKGMNLHGLEGFLAWPLILVASATALVKYVKSFKRST